MLFKLSAHWRLATVCVTFVYESRNISCFHCRVVIRISLWHLIVVCVCSFFHLYTETHITFAIGNYKHKLNKTERQWCLSSTNLSNKLLEYCVNRWSETKRTRTLTVFLLQTEHTINYCIILFALRNTIFNIWATILWSVHNTEWMKFVDIQNCVSVKNSLSNVWLLVNWKMKWFVCNATVSILINMWSNWTCFWIVSSPEAAQIVLDRFRTASCLDCVRAVARKME